MNWQIPIHDLYFQQVPLLPYLSPHLQWLPSSCPFQEQPAIGMLKEEKICIKKYDIEQGVFPIHVGQFYAITEE